MDENTTVREVEIKWEIHYYHPETPDTWHEPGSKEEIEYDAWFVVEENGREILVEIPEDMRQALSLDREIIDYIKDRASCMKGRELAEEREDYLDTMSAALFKTM